MPRHTKKKTKVKTPRFEHGGEAPKKTKRKTLKQLVAEKKARGEKRGGTLLEEPLETDETPKETERRIKRQKRQGKRRKTIKPS